jgi:alpha,alpha-trehalase
MPRYWANTDAPRPESWREDVALATEECGFDVDSSEAKAMWREIATAAESGHDFSSRWLEDDAADDDDDDGVGSGGVGGDAPPTPASLRSIRTTRIVPADLNGFMLKTESCVSRIARLVGDDVVAETFDARATERASAMRDVCWDDAHGRWRDVVLPRRASDPSLALDEEISYASEGFVRGVYASDYVPLWCGAASLDPKLALECVKSIRSSGLILPGGIASSLRHTGHQWDYPNAWAPLAHVVVEGLDAHGGDEGKKLAREIAVRWVESNATLFRKTGYMHEKYDARTPGERPGGGGEYVPQRGFGWSNGVALAFLEKYCVAVADE